MKIEDLEADGEFRWQRERELRHVIEQPSAREARVCPGCDIHCSKCGSTVCTCNCSPDCPDAPLQLTSDPENHPVEPAIVPLVYALNELRVYHPCWSCEGHVDDDGGLIRAPRVWFYVRATVYLSLINHAVFRLHLDKKISCDWQVRVVDWGETSDSGFSLEPVTRPGEKADLAALQRDVEVIAENLRSEVHQAAESYLNDMAVKRAI